MPEERGIVGMSRESQKITCWERKCSQRATVPLATGSALGARPRFHLPCHLCVYWTMSFVCCVPSKQAECLWSVVLSLSTRPTCACAGNHGDPPAHRPQWTARFWPMDMSRSWGPWSQMHSSAQCVAERSSSSSHT